MLRWRGVLAVAGTAFALLPIAGCAIVDKYSDRAVEYNLQAEKTQQQNLLLNIIRASLRRPMQFTGLSSISGNATASGGVAGGYTNQHQTPYISLFGITPSNTSSIVARTVAGTGSGTASMSGGQNFTVPVLDTQEFYQGILSPVSHQIIDYYVQQGFPPEVLFDLFVANVELVVTDGGSCDRFTFRNDVRNHLRFGQFQALADYLLSSGFTTERVTDRIQYGPPIAASGEKLSATETAQMVDAYSKASAAGLDIRSENGVYRMQRRSSHYRFCFAVNGDQRPVWLDITPDAYCGNAAVRVPSAKARAQAVARGGTRGDHCPPVPEAQGSGDGGTSQFHGILLSQTFLNRIKELQDGEYAKGNVSYEDYFPINRFQRKHVTFRFQTRSVEGILYYLGEITRQHLTPETGRTSRLTQVKTGLRYGAMPRTDCDVAENDGKYQSKHDLVPLMHSRAHDGRPYSCENLFVLESGPAADAFYTVSYDGMTYSIPNDPARAGRSLQVLELVKQLMALNTSAKQLPQSSVISIIGGTAQ